MGDPCECRIQHGFAAAANAKMHVCKAMAAKPELMKSMTWETHKIANGMLSVASVPKIMTADQGTAHGPRRSLRPGQRQGRPLGNLHDSCRRAETGTITAVRLEALDAPRLPMNGPGRAANGNFVLSQFTFETDGVPHGFRKAIADFSQANTTSAMSSRATSPRAGRSTPADPKERKSIARPSSTWKSRTPCREGQAFVFTLRFSDMPKGYALGRFRIAVTFASERFLDLPLEPRRSC